MMGQSENTGGINSAKQVIGHDRETDEWESLSLNVVLMNSQCQNGPRQNCSLQRVGKYDWHKCHQGEHVCHGVGKSTPLVPAVWVPEAAVYGVRPA